MAEVTLLLPVHNGERYLRESISSVLSQDFSDFELLVIDSGSDSSGRIAEDFADPRLRYIRVAPGTPLFSKLNFGVRNSNSPLIRLWADDDRMLPRSLSTFVEFARTHSECGLVYGDFFAIDSAGMRMGRGAFQAGVRARTPEVASPDLAAFLFWCFGCLPGNISTVLLRREAWDAVGGFREGWRMAGDFEMWVRVSERFSVGYVAEPLLEIRSHSSQLSKRIDHLAIAVREEVELWTRLLVRLSRYMSRTDLLDGWMRGRGRMHVHAVLRLAASGRVSDALEGLQALGRLSALPRQVLVWALTANGRIGRQDRFALFDLNRHQFEAHVS